MELNTVLDRLTLLAGHARPNLQGACIQDSRVGVFLFRHFGYEAQALVIHHHFENENWSVGTGGIAGFDPTQGKPSSYNPAYQLQGADFHVVTFLPKELVIVDMCCGQTSRPERGLWLDQQVQIFEFTPDVYQHFIAGGAVETQRGNGNLFIKIHPDQESFKSTPAWRDKAELKRVARNLARVIEAMEMKAA